MTPWVELSFVACMTLLPTGSSKRSPGPNVTGASPSIVIVS